MMMLRATIIVLVSLFALGDALPAASEVDLGRRALLITPVPDVALSQIVTACSMTGCTVFTESLTVTINDQLQSASKICAPKAVTLTYGSFSNDVTVCTSAITVTLNIPEAKALTMNAPTAATITVNSNKASCVLINAPVLVTLTLNAVSTTYAYLNVLAPIVLATSGPASASGLVFLSPIAPAVSITALTAVSVFVKAGAAAAVTIKAPLSTCTSAYAPSMAAASISTPKAAIVRLLAPSAAVINIAAMTGTAVTLMGVPVTAVVVVTPKTAVVSKVAVSSNTSVWAPRNPPAYCT